MNAKPALDAPPKSAITIKPVLNKKKKVLKKTASKALPEEATETLFPKKTTKKVHFDYKKYKALKKLKLQKQIFENQNKLTILSEKTLYSGQKVIIDNFIKQKIKFEIFSSLFCKQI